MNNQQLKSSQAQLVTAKRCYQRHREERRQAGKRYYLLHKEQLNKKNKGYQEAHRHPCPVCGVIISYNASHCRSHALRPKGKESKKWKGGRQKEKKGYIRVYAPEHPRSHDNYVLEHILIWEQANGKLLPQGWVIHHLNGKPLPQGWVVHHLNGIRDDNRIKNLQAMLSKKHSLLIDALHKQIQELEAQLNNQYHLL